MQVSFALFADAANLSQEGKLNVLGVFDAVQVATLPTVHPRAHLVLRFKGARVDVGTHTVTLRWLNPEGVELWSTTGDLDIAAPPNEVREMDLPLIASIDLPIDRVGRFTMNISLDDIPTAEVALTVRSTAGMGVSKGMLA
ncbi:MAG TPA: hypothetical protein VMM18_14090 [Gemmatimonadaceae bacterium]|nr:hypothetical protein [Gemmatimonadaceae bacterium]